MAKEIKLTQGQAAIVDDEDFEWLNQWEWYAAWRANAQKFYAVRNSPYNEGPRRLILMHRFIMDAPKGVLIDHVIHSETLNNQRSNLRVATRAQNACNSRLRSDNSSGFKGVSWHKAANKWISQISIGGRFVLIGFFDNKEEAARAYDRSAIENFGEFAVLNFQIESLYA
jgi:AP2 domain